MKYFKIKNWEKYQHPDTLRGQGPMKWIRMEVTLIYDETTRELDTNSRLTWMLLLLYSGQTRNKLPWSPRLLKSILGTARAPNLHLFEELGLIEVFDASNSLADCKQNASLEKSRVEKSRVEKSRGGDPVAKAAPPPLENKQAAIALYCEEFKNRYQATATIRGKESGQLSKLLKDLGESKFNRIISAYFQMNDSWFVTKRHDVSTLVQNLNNISIFTETGKEINPLNKAVIRDQENENVMKRYLEKTATNV